MQPHHLLVIKLNCSQSFMVDCITSSWFYVVPQIMVKDKPFGLALDLTYLDKELDHSLRLCSFDLYGTLGREMHKFQDYSGEIYKWHF